MNKDKVAILLSTYNGEKYIREQIDSLLNQTYENIEIYVRDDGSVDKTPQILKEYEKNGKITLTLGNNIGFIKSFLELLSYPKDSKYYSFCDQDDIWLEDKIERSVKKIKEKDSSKPILYSSNYDCYDSNMNYIKGSGYAKNKSTEFYKSVIECVSPGMTMCINNVAKEMLVNAFPNEAFFHDWWICLVCSGLGVVIYDSKVTVKYRIHESNVTVSTNGFFKDIKTKIKRYFGNSFYKKIKKQCIEFYQIYGDKLSRENKNFLELFINKKYSLKKQIKKIFYRRRYKNNIKDEIFIRFIFILGKL